MKKYIFFLIPVFMVFSIRAQMIQSVSPDNGSTGDLLTVTITGVGTSFIQSSSTFWFSAGSSTFSPFSITVSSPYSMTGEVQIPLDAQEGYYDVTACCPWVFKEYGFYVNSTAPKIWDISPDNAYAGDNLNISITGENTNFIQGNTTLFFSQSSSTTIQVNSVNVSNQENLIANISVPWGAVEDFYDVQIVDGSSNYFYRTDGFTVLPYWDAAMVKSEPDEGVRDQVLPITITGSNTHFLQGSTSVWFSMGSNTLSLSNLNVANTSTITANLIIPDDALIGNYSLTGYDSYGYVQSKPYAFRVTDCSPPTVTVQPENNAVCPGASVTFSVEASGTDTLLYSWQKNGTIIPGASDHIYNITNVTTDDEGQYKCIVSNQCGSDVSNYALLTVNPVPVVNTGDDISICNGSSGTLSATGGTTYLWSNGATSGSISVSPESTTTYFVTASNSYGCTSTGSVTVNVKNVFEDEEICIVTVDPVTGKNMIIWEKTENEGTEVYRIYKEISLNNYQWLTDLSFGEESVYIDYTSFPSSYAEKYKLSVIDSCGNESEMSDYHKTINLQIGQGVPQTTINLAWNAYEDESGALPISNYFIYKGTSTENLTLYHTISGSFTAYNDLNVYDTYYYAVGVSKPGGCNPTGGKSTYDMSLSNIETNGTGIRENEEAGFFKITPNPFRDKTVIEFDNPAGEEFMLTITDITGKVIRKREGITSERVEIERGELRAGIYTVELKCNKSFKGRLVIE